MSAVPALLSFGPTQDDPQVCGRVHTNDVDWLAGVLFVEAAETLAQRDDLSCVDGDVGRLPLQPGPSIVLHETPG